MLGNLGETFKTFRCCRIVDIGEESIGELNFSFVPKDSRCRAQSRKIFVVGKLCDALKDPIWEM